METRASPTTLLQKEVAYYRQLSSRLGRDLVRAQQLLDSANLEIRGHELRRLLERELSLVAATAISLPALCSRIAKSVIEHTLCSRVLVLAEDEPGSQSFRVLEAAGTSTSELPQEITLARVPTFAFANSTRCHPSTATEALKRLGEILGLPSVMWSYDTETGFAILMATALGPAVAEFDAGDEDARQRRSGETGRRRLAAALAATPRYGTARSDGEHSDSEHPRPVGGHAGH